MTPVGLTEGGGGYYATTSSLEMCSYSSLPTIDHELSIQAALEDCPAAGNELDLGLALARAGGGGALDNLAPGDR